MMKRVFHFLLLGLVFCLAGCKPENESTNIYLSIDYKIDGQMVTFDSLGYQNDAGNQYMVNEIQWFISHVEIKNEKGKWIKFNNDSDIQYLEASAQGRTRLHEQTLPKDHYTALRFTFGLDEAENQTGTFNNPPESEMFWPEPLGGGYHYMKLNGKWLNAEGELVPLCIHLGIGQNAELTEFYPNYFSVEIPFDEVIGRTYACSINLSMEINNWFRNPHTYDFSDYGSGIMQNQTAQQVLKENGCDVFSVTAINFFKE